MNLEQCWDLINLSEKTRKHCMILENCCYDYYELNALVGEQSPLDAVHHGGAGKAPKRPPSTPA